MANRFANQVLKKGSKGDAVHYLQQQLVDNFKAKISPDGDFGSKTKSATQKFQKDAGLKEDGVVGKNTWTKLDSKASSKPPPLQQEAPPEPSANECVLAVYVRRPCKRSRGMVHCQGADVRIGKFKGRTRTKGDTTLKVKPGIYTAEVKCNGYELDDSSKNLRIRALAGGTLTVYLKMVPKS
jgi:peptidoglycan hydrolase-like protein with peptidoglycan-binding domain